MCSTVLSAHAQVVITQFVFGCREEAKLLESTGYRVDIGSHTKKFYRVHVQPHLRKASSHPNHVPSSDDANANASSSGSTKHTQSTKEQTTPSRKHNSMWGWEVPKSGWNAKQTEGSSAPGVQITCKLHNGACLQRFSFTCNTHKHIHSLALPSCIYRYHRHRCVWVGKSRC